MLQSSCEGREEGPGGGEEGRGCRWKRGEMGPWRKEGSSKVVVVAVVAAAGSNSLWPLLILRPGKSKCSRSRPMLLPLLLLLLSSITCLSSFSSSTHLSFLSFLAAPRKEVHEDDEGKYAWICSGLQSLKCVCFTVKVGDEEEEKEEEEEEEDGADGEHGKFCR